MVTDRRAWPRPAAGEIPTESGLSMPMALGTCGVAIFYASVLPWWMPLVWWLLVVATGIFRTWYIRNKSLTELPLRRRIWIQRILVWSFSAAMSSAAYFLYVPSDPLKQALLCFFGLCLALIFIFYVSARDPWRGSGGLVILMLPTILRLILEGAISGETSTLAMGGVALYVMLILARVSIVHTRLKAQQIDAQLKAERAADGMALLAITKSRFFAAVSHDLRQPVHAIGLYLDPITKLAHRDGDPTALRAVVGVAQSWQILNDLLSQVMDIARLEADVVIPEMARHEVASLVEDLVVQHSSFAESVGVRLVALTRPNQFVHADKVLLQRVLSNLIANAIKFSPAGKSVVIAVRPWRSEWRIQVRDAGSGIALAEQQRIFEEFVQINNQSRDRQQGLGLGLAIAKRLTELQGGTLGVRSRLGHGCCMTVLLPRSHHSTGVTLQDPIAHPFVNTDSLIFSTQKPHGEQKYSVLLVEDDLLVGGAMTELMNGWGLDVHWEKTVSAARAYTGEPDVVICDWRLPGEVSGWKLALQFKSEGRRVMMVTGETDEKLRDMATEHEVPLLIKPVAPQALWQAIRQLLS